MISGENGHPLEGSPENGISGTLVIAYKKVGRGKLYLLEAGIQWKGANEKSFDITYKDVQSSAKSSKSSDGTEGEEFLLMAVGVSPDVLGRTADDVLDGQDSDNDSNPEAEFVDDSQPGCILQFFPDDNSVLQQLYTTTVDGIKRNSSTVEDLDELSDEDSEVDGMYDDDSDEANGGIEEAH